MSFGEQFLRLPDLFPARASGEAWGEQEILFDCVGGPYLFSGLSGAQAEAVRGRFDELCRPVADAAVPAVTLRLFQAAETDFNPDPFTDGYYSIETDYGQESIRIAGRDFMARLEWRPGLSAAVWAAGDREFVKAGDFENVLRFLVAERLLEIGGLLLHSSGVVIGGAAHLFFGYSGAGKTTVAELALARGYEVLSDDLNLLVPGPEGPRATRSPFAGAMGRTRVREDSYPLRGLYRLVKGEDNHIQPLSQASAVAALAGRSPFVNRDPCRDTRLMDNLTTLTSAVPVSALTFNRTGGFWDLLS